MRLVRIFLMVSPWEPLIMRLRRDRALHGNTARARVIKYLSSNGDFTHKETGSGDPVVTLGEIME
jgi:hypothetical protein